MGSLAGFFIFVFVVTFITIYPSNMSRKPVVILSLVLAFSIMLCAFSFIHRKGQAERTFEDIFYRLEETEYARLQHGSRTSHAMKEIDSLRALDKKYSQHEYMERVTDLGVALDKLEELEEIHESYCANYVEDMLDASEIPVGGRVFLLPTDKQTLLAGLKAALDERDETSISCEPRSANFGHKRVVILLEKAQLDLLNTIETRATSWDDVNRLAPYSNGRFQIPDEDGLREFFGDSYIDTVRQKFNWYGKFYDAIVALDAGFGHLAQQKIDDFDAEYALIVARQDQAQAEILKQYEQLTAKRTKNAEVLLPLIARVETRKPIEKHLWTVSFLIDALGTVHNRTTPDVQYPAVDSVTALFSELEGAGLLTHASAAVPDNISYRVMETGVYQLRYWYREQQHLL